MKKSYTLIELLVSVAVLAIVAFVVIGGCSSSVSNRRTVSKTNLDTIVLPFFTFNPSNDVVNATGEWLINNPNRRLVSVIKKEGFIRDTIVIVSEDK